jgi:hypothetical protein
VENISLAANTVDHRRFVGLIDLTAESPYVNVNKIRVRHKLVVPHFPEEHRSSNQLALMPHHIFEQLKFAWKKID